MFRTKPQLARGMLERAVESGVPFGWVTGDEVCGNGRNLRLWLEQQGIPHVLAVRSNENLWVRTDKGPLQVRADRLASQVEETGWIRWSAGDRAKVPSTTGPPWRYGRSGSRAGATGCWPGAACQARRAGLLRVFRSGGDGPGGTGKGSWNPVGHRGMLRGGQGTGGSGPIRGTTLGWLAPAHHAGDAGPRPSGGGQAPSFGARMPGRKRGSPSLDAGLISLTAPEVRRLLTRLVWTANQPAGFVLAWCRWTRRRQATAQRCHYQRRLKMLASHLRL